MAGCHYVMGAIWLGSMAVFAGKLRAFLMQPRIKAGLETLSGVAMVGFGARLALARAR